MASVSLGKMKSELLYASKARDLMVSAEKNGGNFKLMAADCDLTVAQINRYYKKYPKFKEIVDNAREAVYQKVLGKLEELMEKGNIQAISLFLSKSPWAKSNGWGDRQELTQQITLTDAEKAKAAKDLLGIEE